MTRETNAGKMPRRVVLAGLGMASLPVAGVVMLSPPKIVIRNGWVLAEEDR